MTRYATFAASLVLVLAMEASHRRTYAQQSADAGFDVSVATPAYPSRHPSVLFDHAHNNFHTLDGRYKPFADLIRNDGYAVAPNREPFEGKTLEGRDILVIAGATGDPRVRGQKSDSPAFSDAECDAVHEWVHAGGGLLLITDQFPWGSAAESLARRFGVESGKSTTSDPVNSEPGLTARLVFSRENALLGIHPIIAGRDRAQRIDRVMTFSGQSLKGPSDSTALLKLGDSAVDQAVPGADGRTGSAAGRAQAIALTLGKGRVVILGEAGMLSAQRVGRDNAPMGMNTPGTDNRQLALNIMHWLSGLDIPATSSALAATTPPAPKTDEPHGPLPTIPKLAAPRPMSPAEIAAESEASIGLIQGESNSATGFVARPGRVVTNAHVIESEPIAKIRVRFPSAEKDQQGPLPVELLYEDLRRDLAILVVKTPLPPLRLARSFKFRKGEEVTVIGNPSVGSQLILENAISKGLMSTRAEIDGRSYYQLGITINAGNSGGPVFDSTGQVIGVVTRKSTAQDALAFCIPIEDLNRAIDCVATVTDEVIDRAQSSHRLALTVRGLGAGGANYSFALKARNLKAQPQGTTARDFQRAFYEAAARRFENQTFSRVSADLARVREDRFVPAEVLAKVVALAENLEKLKARFANKAPADAQDDPAATLILTHGRLLREVCKVIALELPPSTALAFDVPPADFGRPPANPEPVKP